MNIFVYGIETIANEIQAIVEHKPMWKLVTHFTEKKVFLKYDGERFATVYMSPSGDVVYFDCARNYKDTDFLEIVEVLKNLTNIKNVVIKLP
jgi:hypothetical protein